MAANLLLLTLNSFKALFCAPQVLLILLTGNKDFFFFFSPLSGKYFKIIIIKITRSGPGTFCCRASWPLGQRDQSRTSKAPEGWKSKRKPGRAMQRMATSVKSPDTPRDGTPAGRRMGKGGEAQHLSMAAPNNVPLFPQPGTCCQRQGGRGGNGGKSVSEAAWGGRTVGHWGSESPLGECPACGRARRFLGERGAGRVQAAGRVHLCGQPCLQHKHTGGRVPQAELGKVGSPAPSLIPPSKGGSRTTTRSPAPLAQTLGRGELLCVKDIQARSQKS